MLQGPAPSNGLHPESDRAVFEPQNFSESRIGGKIRRDFQPATAPAFDPLSILGLALDKPKLCTRTGNLRL